MACGTALIMSGLSGILREGTGLGFLGPDGGRSWVFLAGRGAVYGRSSDWYNEATRGGVAEWSNAAVLKIADAQASAGSNPVPSVLPLSAGWQGRGAGGRQNQGAEGKPRAWLSLPAAPLTVSVGVTVTHIICFYPVQPLGKLLCRGLRRPLPEQPVHEADLPGEEQAEGGAGETGGETDVAHHLAQPPRGEPQG
jgi:hypothetical protein